MVLCANERNGGDGCEERNGPVSVDLHSYILDKLLLMSYH